MIVSIIVGSERIEIDTKDLLLISETWPDGTIKGRHVLFHFRLNTIGVPTVDPGFEKFWDEIQSAVAAELKLCKTLPRQLDPIIWPLDVAGEPIWVEIMPEKKEKKSWLGMMLSPDTSVTRDLSAAASKYLPEVRMEELEKAEPPSHVNPGKSDMVSFFKYQFRNKTKEELEVITGSGQMTEEAKQAAMELLAKINSDE